MEKKCVIYTKNIGCPAIWTTGFILTYNLLQLQKKIITNYNYN